MRTPKKPPPDNVGNLYGRIRQLKIAARRNAQMTAKEGGDYDRALAKAMREFEPRFKNLRARLAKVQGKAPATKPQKAPEAPTTKPKKRSAARVPADYDDLLATLGDL